jgi:hypothetical protein
VAGENFLENLPVAPCATDKFSNIENFAADSKMFKKIHAYSKFFEKILADSKKLYGTYP